MDVRVLSTGHLVQLLSHYTGAHLLETLVHSAMYVSFDPGIIALIGMPWRESSYAHILWDIIAPHTHGIWWWVNNMEFIGLTYNQMVWSSVARFHPFSALIVFDKLVPSSYPLIRYVRGFFLRIQYKPGVQHRGDHWVSWMVGYIHAG